jgi:hypothetical protein
MALADSFCECPYHKEMTMTTMKPERRDFIKWIGGGTGLVLISPIVSACASSKGTQSSVVHPERRGMPQIPEVRPLKWDPIAFNRDRGNAGAIPESYRESINGPDGRTKHIGKHLPYLPEVDPALVPSGFVAIMWGDPAKGYTKHPNSSKNEDTGYAGHWYSWIKIRKASGGAAEERETIFDNWPAPRGEGSGQFAVWGGGEITDDTGKKTIYLARLPTDVIPGDEIRITGHCINHGEYVDFLTLS